MEEVEVVRLEVVMECKVFQPSTFGGILNKAELHSCCRLDMAKSVKFDTWVQVVLRASLYSAVQLMADHAVSLLSRALEKLLESLWGLLFEFQGKL